MTKFQQARLKLTLIYTLILAIILLTFSVLLYRAVSQDFVHIIVQRTFAGRTLRPLPSLERSEVVSQVDELNRRIIYELLVLDGAILLAGAALSYYLADVTMQPIQQALEQQQQFLADASHELRTPLAAILTTAELAERRLSATDQQTKRSLNQIEKRGQLMAKMLNQLLELSRAEIATDNVTLEPTRLDQVVQAVASDFSARAAEKKITLTVGAKQPVFVLGQSDRLTQLVSILLDNALKYTVSGGTISIQLEQLPTPKLIVVDSGIGIAEDQLERIFERFFRAESARTTESGVGLGLSIAKTIARAHQATVSVKSTLHKGSRFTVTFPRFRAESDEAMSQGERG